MTVPSRSDHTPCGGTLVATTGRALPLRSARLSGQLRGGLARVVLEQTFENPHADPLRVTYQLPLPDDAAVSGFSFRIGAREIVGEVDRKARARERFEEAIAEGRTAAHLEQERSSLFTQQLGNIPPHTTVVARIEIDQPLQWILDAKADAGGWEWRFPTVVAPRYLAEAGRVPDAERVHVQVADRPRPITMSLDVQIGDLRSDARSSWSSYREGREREVRSPSHAVRVSTDGRVCFADDAVGLDRDVVLRWPVATPRVGLDLDLARPPEGHAKADSAFGLVTLVPPSIRPDAVARDLIVLLDTSGSMGGEPIEQAKRVAGALVDSLGSADTVELIEFSNRPRRFKGDPRRADDRTKGKAQAWLSSLRAGGGTEMVSGILAALADVRAEAQRQVVVITDGLIGFERDVVAAILERLPSGSRLHTVGVGSAVNRSLTGPAARAGRGVEVVIGLGEDPERAARRLLARTHEPVVVDVELSGPALAEHAPLRLPDLYSASPALASVRLAAGGGELVVRGRTASGTWEARTTVPPCAPGEGSPVVVTRFARERVEDLELSRTAGADARHTDETITSLGLQYRIVTRLTSWVAISDRIDVDPGDPTRAETIPQELPYGMSIEGLGLRSASAPMQAQAMTMAGMPRRKFAARPAPPPAAAPVAIAGPPSGAVPGGGAPGGIDGFADGYGGSFDGEADELDASVERDLEGKMAEEAPEPPPASRTRSAPAPRAPERSRGRHSARKKREQTLDNKGEGSAGAPLRGTIRTRTDRRWIVEVKLDAALTWAPDGRVTIALHDGTEVTARLVAGTTRAGSLVAGSVLRLVLELDAATDGTPTHLALTNDGTPERILL